MVNLKKPQICRAFLSALELEIPYLRRHALALTIDKVGADRLVERCLSETISTAGNESADASLRYCLFKIQRNLFISKFGDNKSVPLPEMASRGQDKQLSDVTQIQDALNSLSYKQREVFFLICIEGASYEDVAWITGSEIATVRSYLSQARERIRTATSVP